MREKIAANSVPDVVDVSVDTHEKLSKLASKMEEYERNASIDGNVSDEGFVPLESDVRSEISNVKEEEVPTEDKKVEESSKEVEYSDTEKEALSLGWRPLSEFTGDKEDYRSAKDFLRWREITHRTSELARQNRFLTEKLDNLQKHIVTDKASDILNKKRKAIADGDVMSAEEYEKQFYSLHLDNERGKDPGVVNEKPIVTNNAEEAARAFAKKHESWYILDEGDGKENDEMKAFTHQKVSELVEIYPDMSHNDRLKKVEEALGRRYPHRFGLPSNVEARGRAPAVSLVNHSPQPTRKQEVKISYETLPFHIKADISNVATGLGYSEEEYTDMLVKRKILTVKDGVIDYAT